MKLNANGSLLANETLMDPMKCKCIEWIYDYTNLSLSDGAS